MDRHAALERALACGLAALVERGDPGQCVLGRGDRRIAGVAHRRARLRAGEDRQHGVADALEDLAAPGHDRFGHAVEIVVEQGDHLGQRPGLGQRGEAAQVAVPDDRMDDLAVAALDRAVEDALAGVGPDVGAEQVTSGAPQLLQLDDRGQGRQRRIEHGEVQFGETAGAVGGDADSVSDAAREGERPHGVVGEAARLEVLNDGVVERTIGLLEPAADRAAVLADRPHRRGQVHVAALDAMLVAELDRAAGVPVPDQAAGRELRVQLPNVQRGARDRQAGVAQAAREAVEQEGHARRAQPLLVHQPGDYRPGAALGLGGKSGGIVQGRHGWSRGKTDGPKQDRGPTRRAQAAALATLAEAAELAPEISPEG